MPKLLLGQLHLLLKVNRPQLNIRIALPAMPETLMLVESCTIEFVLNIKKLEARLLPVIILQLSVLGLVMRQLLLLLKTKQSTLLQLQLSNGMQVQRENAQ